jgi:hypothetical protein
VFVISCFDPSVASRSPEKILTVGESSGGNSAPSKPKGQSATAEASESFGAGSKPRTAIIGSDIVGPLAASDWKFPQQQQVYENKIVMQDELVYETSTSAT